MKRTVLVILIALTVCVAASAEDFRLGGVAGVELVNSPTFADVRKEFDDTANIMPGWYFEVIPENLGFGMTNLLKFNRESESRESASMEKGSDYRWYFDWIASLDLRYHFFERSLLDPFVEAGFGSAGRVELHPEEEQYVYESQRYEEPIYLSLFTQVGGGVGLRFDQLHLGGRVLYRFSNSPPPATHFLPYPLKRFHFNLYVGVNF